MTPEEAARTCVFSYVRAKDADLGGAQAPLLAYLSVLGRRAYPDEIACALGIGRSTVKHYLTGLGKRGLVSSARGVVPGARGLRHVYGTTRAGARAVFETVCGGDAGGKP